MRVTSQGVAGYRPVVGFAAAALILVGLIAAYVTIKTRPSGTISLAWDPPASDEVAGYRIYYGTAAGRYDRQIDVGPVTEYTVTGLRDCTDWYLAVKAYDARGLESPNFSGEVSGWPRPVVLEAIPSRGEPGQSLTVKIRGRNFREGAELQFSNFRIAVNSVVVNSCRELTASVTIAADSPTGPASIEVVNHPDLAFGGGLDLFTVVEPRRL